MTFIFLPLLGLSMAFQTIIGNNVGGQKWDRANSCITIALTTSFVYSVTMQIIVWSVKDTFGDIFVDDAAIVSEVSRILPFTTMALFVFGPQLMITLFFQAIGDARRAAILGVVKTYCFILPLLFISPYIWGEWGIWYATPWAELLGVLLTLTILYRRYAKLGNPLGLYFVSEHQPSEKEAVLFSSSSQTEGA